VGLAQVKSLMVELVHSGSNLRVDMSIVFTVNYFFMGDDVSVYNDALLVTNFVNLKIKMIQSFGYAHKGKVYVRVFIGVSARTCIIIYVITVFLNKKKSLVGLGLKPLCSSRGSHSMNRCHFFSSRWWIPISV
jgi:hypothetical protein